MSHHEPEPPPPEDGADERGHHGHAADGGHHLGHDAANKAAKQGAKHLAKAGKKQAAKTGAKDAVKAGLEAAGIEGATEVWWGIKLALKILPYALALAALMLAMTFLVVIGISSSAEAGSGGLRCQASAKGSAEIPAAFSGVNLMDTFRSAAGATDNPRQKPLGDRGTWILAAIAGIESGFGQNMGPSSAGAVGFMQFMPATWRQVGVDTDGDGKPDRAYGDVDGDGTLDDPKDPSAAVQAAGSYLRAAGAPASWYKAIFAYNHADWYVDEVEKLADAYQGTCTMNVVAMTGLSPGGTTRVTASEPWLVPVPGTNVRCDARIVANVMYLIQRFKLAVGSCYAPTGHSASGEHPLGLGIDVWPEDGNWENTMAAARFVGWDEACARAGCPNKLARWIGYNGVPNHGDPEHCSAGCPAHLHISWNHAPTPYNTQAPWVDVWQIPGAAST